MASQRLRDMIIRHEGEVLTLYHDSEGIPTIGVGRNLERVPAISREESRFMLDHDIEDATNDLFTQWPRYAWFVEVRQDVLVDMVFNLGINRFAGFNKMHAALDCHQYEEAAVEMLDSKWARQVGKRATELARMMRTGLYDV